ncbi:hypothetical protein V6N13_011809 [Hibiscus sabdariffa]|uniref:Uncharacterized protein n=1 Tax=Hibiscus sabdariffa TaxID=183260 RepID=A0ABR2SDX2_9ROSI
MRRFEVTRHAWEQENFVARKCCYCSHGPWLISFERGRQLQVDWVSLSFIIQFTAFIFNKRKDGVPPRGNERDNNYVLPAAELHVKIVRFNRGLGASKFKEIKKATQNFSSKNRINGSVNSGCFGS